MGTKPLKALRLRTPWPATGVCRPECPREYPRECPQKRGCPRECPTGCLQGPSGPGPQSVQKVSRECPRVSKKGVPDTWGTLSGHFLDTLGPGAQRALETPRRTLPRTPPVFGDTLGEGGGGPGTGDTSGPKGPRDSGRVLNSQGILGL